MLIANVDNFINSIFSRYADINEGNYSGISIVFAKNSFESEIQPNVVKQISNFYYYNSYANENNIYNLQMNYNYLSHILDRAFTTHLTTLNNQINTLNKFDFQQVMERSVSKDIITNTRIVNKKLETVYNWYKSESEAEVYFRGFFPSTTIGNNYIFNRQNLVVAKNINQNNLRKDENRSVNNSSLQVLNKNENHTAIDNSSLQVLHKKENRTVTDNSSQNNLRKYEENITLNKSNQQILRKYESNIFLQTTRQILATLEREFLREVEKRILINQNVGHYESKKNIIAKSDMYVSENEAVNRYKFLLNQNNSKNFKLSRNYNEKLTINQSIEMLNDSHISSENNFLEGNNLWGINHKNINMYYKEADRLNESLNRQSELLINKIVKMTTGQVQSSAQGEQSSVLRQDNAQNARNSLFLQTNETHTFTKENNSINVDTINKISRISNVSEVFKKVRTQEDVAKKSTETIKTAQTLLKEEHQTDIKINEQQIADNVKKDLRKTNKVTTEDIALLNFVKNLNEREEHNRKFEEKLLTQIEENKLRTVSENILESKIIEANIKRFAPADVTHSVVAPLLHKNGESKTTEQVLNKIKLVDETIEITKESILKISKQQMETTKNSIKEPSTIIFSDFVKNKSIIRMSGQNKQFRMTKRELIKPEINMAMINEIAEKVSSQMFNKTAVMTNSKAGESLIHKRAETSRPSNAQNKPTEIFEDIHFTKTQEQLTSHSVSKPINLPQASVTENAVAQNFAPNQQQIKEMADKVYNIIERRLRSEKIRKGLF